MSKPANATWAALGDVGILLEKASDAGMAWAAPDGAWATAAEMATRVLEVGVSAIADYSMRDPKERTAQLRRAVKEARVIAKAARDELDEWQRITELDG